MKKFIILTLIAVSVLAAGCKKDTNSAQNTTETNNIANLFIVGLDDSFPPMGFRDNNNEIVGFDIDMAKEVTKRLGMEIKLQPIDWASKELELSTGKISCIWNGLSVSPAREEAMTLSKPYLANRMVIITNQNSPLNAKADLEGKKVGLQTGSTAVAALEKDPVSEKLTQVTYENNVLALTDLNIGRIDVVVMDEVVARYMISKSANLYKILNDSFDEKSLKLSDLDFIGTSEPYEIDIPNLTYREATALNQILYFDEKENYFINNSIIDKDEIVRYKKYYKYLPNFYDVRL